MIAYILFAGITSSWEQNFIRSLLWIFHVEFWYHLLIGALGLLLSSIFFGKLAGSDILVKGKNVNLTGVKYSFLTLISATILGSTVGFIEEGVIRNELTDAIYDYYLKPLYWVGIFGFIPAVLIGLWFGRTIRRRGNDSDHTSSLH